MQINIADENKGISYEAVIDDSLSVDSIRIIDDKIEINGRDYKSYIKYVKISDVVTKIGRRAFKGVNGLKGVEIPGSVKIIECDAFGDCKLLETAEFSEGLEEIGSCAFENCESLKRIVVPKSVKIIEGHAFSGCKSLETVKLPDELEIIEESAFKDCPSLKNMEFFRNAKFLYGHERNIPNRFYERVLGRNYM